jgi:hypothetical protein
MGLAFLKMDQSRVKWRIKLAQAFEQSHESAIAARGSSGKFRFGWLRGNKNADKEARSGKWALFLLPFITVLREGLEAIIFVGGVSNEFTVDAELILTRRSPSVPLPRLSPFLSLSVSSAVASLGTSSTELALPPPSTGSSSSRPSSCS